jgi:hypothetical protein
MTRRDGTSLLLDQLHHRHLWDESERRIVFRLLDQAHALRDPSDYSTSQGQPVRLLTLSIADEPLPTVQCHERRGPTI